MNARYPSALIRASAGSGKTHQLANRFIALLLSQAAAGKLAPERLVAVTFTRKGAGEFANRIMDGLAKAAGDETERKRLRHDLARLVSGDENLGPIGGVAGVNLPMDAASLQRALAALVDASDRLVLGTIDSFMARSVQTLAFELGVAGFEILDEPGAQRLRQELLTKVFHAASEKGLVDFYQTLKRAVFKSSSNWRQELDRFVDSRHGLFLSLPNADAWGGNGFWTEPLPGKPKACWREQALALSEKVGAMDFGLQAINESLVKSLNWLANRTPGISPDRIPTWLDEQGKLREIWSHWPADDWNFEYYRKVRTIPASVMRPLNSVLTGWLAAEAEALSTKTAAIYEVVAPYEGWYEHVARRNGRLEFADLPLLLAKINKGMTPTKALRSLAFRWHQEFDHWLLDEFQDTSREQWNFLRLWLDEAIRHGAHGRSVFVVGDPKQSIYGWRGGEPRLFDELKGDYGDAFTEQVMANSWRSRPAVLELVNRVCDPQKNPILRDPEKFSAAALSRWHYDHHVPVASRADQPGYAAVLMATDDADNDAASAGNAGDYEDAASTDQLAAQAQMIQSVLGRLKPLEKGCSCAVLTRKNKHALALAQWLRRNGVANVMVEGDATLADQSPVVAALVDALRWLNTPAHTLAGGHVQSTPLWPLLTRPVMREEKEDAPGNWPDRAWRHWRRRISEIGAGEVTRQWCDQLTQIIDDPYAQYCLQPVVQWAHGAGAALALPDWLASMEQLTIRETAAPGFLHVMTIHKAKGLGFDVVFLPDLDFGGSQPDPVLYRRDARGVPTGCLAAPAKWLRAWMPGLQTLKAAQDAEQDLEALCVLYVALTRAREATFVIMQKHKPRAASRARDWLLGGLGSNATPLPVTPPPPPSPWGEGELLWEHGSRQVAIGQDEQKQPRLLAKPELKLIPPLPRRERHRPSDAAHETEAQPGDPSITPDTGGQEFGAAVHAVFEQIEWWRPDQTLEGRPDAVALVRDCLAIPAIRALFTPETQQDEALRELPVELMEPGAWWSGVIDRLVLRYRADARLRQVILVDFKTDNVASADALRDRYAWQLAVYRRAVAHALNIDCAQAEAVLVSTRHQAILTL